MNPDTNNETATETLARAERGGMRNFIGSIMSDMILSDALEVGQSPHQVGSVLDVLWQSREKKSKEVAYYGEVIPHLQSALETLRGMQELTERQIAQHTEAIESMKREVLS